MANMILIPSGPFIMGLNKKEVKRICRRFDLATESLAVTMPQRDVDLPDFYIDKFPVTNAEFYRFVIETGMDWTYGEDNLPAVNVTYHMAKTYAEWAGKRLPTEEEWEKAARGRLGMLFPWGGTWNPDRLSSSVGGLGSLSPVDAHPMGSSPYGVMNMAGNVWEWTSIRHSDDARVIKGGSFKVSEPYQFICSYKSFMPETDSGDCIGFRCVANQGAE
ncbi:MAG: formylglycine-generating enzyme family protein [Armatimonadota bacterium]